MLGKAGKRAEEVTAKARNEPYLSWATLVVMGSILGQRYVSTDPAPAPPQVVINLC